MKEIYLHLRAAFERAQVGEVFPLQPFLSAKQINLQTVYFSSQDTEFMTQSIRFKILFTYDRSAGLMVSIVFSFLVLIY